MTCDVRAMDENAAFAVLPLSFGRFSEESPPRCLLCPNTVRCMAAAAVAVLQSPPRCLLCPNWNKRGYGNEKTHTFQSPPRCLLCPNASLYSRHMLLNLSFKHHDM